MYAAYSVILLFAVTPGQQVTTLPLYTFIVSTLWLLLVNMALPAAVRRIETTRVLTEALLKDQYSTASIDAQVLRIHPPAVLQIYWEDSRPHRASTDRAALVFNVLVCGLIYRRFVGRMMDAREILTHLSPTLLSKVIAVATPWRGPRTSFWILFSAIASQIYLRAILELRGMSFLYEYGVLGSLGVPFGYVLGVIAVAPRTASADWTTALLWTVPMVVVDGMLSLLRCWQAHGEAAGYKAPAVQAQWLLLGLGMMPSLSAGLLLWYLRGMGELKSVQAFVYGQRQNAARRR
jgi:hypothetical protein